MKNFTLFCLLFFTFFLISCNRRTQYETTVGTDENSTATTEIIKDYDTELNFWHLIHNIPVAIEHNVEDLNIVSPWQSNVISNVNIIHFPESCSIMNLEEIDNIKINDVFDKPILNKEILFRSSMVGSAWRDTADILRSFGIYIPLEKIEEMVKNTQGFTTHKIMVENMRLFFLKNYGWSTSFLFMIEYENNSEFYDWNIKIGTSRNEITKRFGEPTYFTETRCVYIYESFSTFRSANITFDNNDKVRKVQLLAFDGI